MDQIGHYKFEPYRLEQTISYVAVVNEDPTYLLQYLVDHWDDIDDARRLNYVKRALAKLNQIETEVSAVLSDPEDNYKIVIKHNESLEGPITI